MQELSVIFQEFDLTTTIGIIIFTSLLMLIPILLTYLISMHSSLCRQLDPLLFKEPWFKLAQLTMFDSWPLSLIKSINYMLLIGFPTLTLKTNKFHSLKLKDVPTVSSTFKIACRIYSILHITVSFIAVALFLYIGWYYLFY